MTARGKFAWGMIILLGILHFDFWLWESDTLVFGFMPIALAYHAGISLLAALSWALVVQWDWPDELEEWAEAGASQADGGDA
ncbi:MAG: hypothetical protein ACI82F_003068 [Planctomycetota bacterium]|jgi:hypothetical protein